MTRILTLTKRQSVQLSNKHSYQIPLFFCCCLFPVTCHWRASQFHSTWDYKYSIDGRIVAKDKLKMILEEVIFVHARYCPEILWRDWGRRSVVTASWPRLDSDFAKTGLGHYRYINLPDNCQMARKHLCIIVCRADRAHQARWTGHWWKTRNGWWASKQQFNQESRARLVDNTKMQQNILGLMDAQRFWMASKSKFQGASLF